AVILEATFKLQPLPEADRLLAFTSPTLDPLFGFGAALADSALAPQFVEIVVEGSAAPRLVVCLAGLVEEVEEAGRRALALAADLGVELSPETPVDDDFYAMLEKFVADRDGAVVLRAGVRREAACGWLAQALTEAQAIAPAVRAHAHAGIGIARVHLDGSDA